MGPLNGKCNRRSVIYKATTQNADTHFYIGVTENFKPRWYHHRQTFKNTELKKPLPYLRSRGTETWENSLTYTAKSLTKPNPINQAMESANYASRRSCKSCNTTNREIASTDAMKWY